MASEAKEMKYRRRGRVPGPPEHGQRSDRSGALDWAALKHDPAELLRKLDEVRDQITRSCELVADCYRVRSRRTVSLRPTHAESPPPYTACPGPDHYRSRYVGRHRTSLPPSSYDRSQGFVSDDAYARQLFRQQYYHEGQRESHVRRHQPTTAPANARTTSRASGRWRRCWMTTS